MPSYTTVPVPAGTWTQLTAADVTSITFQNVSSMHVMVKVTANDTAPTDAAGAIRYNPGQGERNVLLSDLCPGVVGKRVWAFSPDRSLVSVSHA